MPTIYRGLKDVYFDQSEASFIDGSVGKLLYRGYDIHDLAAHSTFEETAYLLLLGKLPDSQELEDFKNQLAGSRNIPPQVIDIIRLVQKSHPMDVLRTAVSALAAFDPDVSDNSIEATLRKGMRLTAQAPTITAAHARIREGKKVVPPNPHLSHAANFLYMLFGKEPDEYDARTIDLDFVLHAEHGPNASAFTARVVAGTISDLHSAVVAAIGALKGPAHGGAAEDVMKTAVEIGEPSRAKDYVKAKLDRGERLMGFGHRVYKAEDPRARHLRERAREIAEKKGQPKWFEILTRVYEAMTPYQSRGIFVNVDFYAGSIYHLLDIPQDLFISMFALGRFPGWTLQCLEQYANNILIRPLTEYVGPMDLPYIPMEQRRAVQEKLA